MLNLNNFMPKSQIEALKAIILDGEEQEAALQIVRDIKSKIAHTPALYATEEQENPLAHLHYFSGNYDAYIIERASDGYAYGYASFSGYDFEGGYIDIKELIANNIELDLHFEPTPINDLI